MKPSSPTTSTPNIITFTTALGLLCACGTQPSLFQLELFRAGEGGYHTFGVRSPNEPS